jgi:chromosome segregation ATPase
MAGVTEKKQQDEVFSEAKKAGLQTIGVTPLSWLGSAILTTVTSKSVNLATLQDNLYTSGVALAFGAALTVGQSIYSKVGEAREGSKQMRADRAAGKDPDTPVLDQLQKHDQSIDALNTRSRRVQHLLSGFVRSVKNSLKKTDERVDGVAAEIAAMRQQMASMQQQMAAKDQAIAGLQQELTAHKANTAGQLEATQRHTEERIGASEQRTSSALNAHRSHVGAELAQHSEKLDQHDEKLTRHDAGFGHAQAAVGRLETAVYGSRTPGSPSFTDQAHALHQRSRQQRDQSRGRATPPADPPGPSLPPTPPGTRPTGHRPRQ